MRQKPIDKNMAKQQHFVEIRDGLEEFGIFEPVKLKVSAKPVTAVQGFDMHIPESTYLRINRVPIKQGDRVPPLRSATLLLGLPITTYNKNREGHVLASITKTLGETRKLLRENGESDS